MAQENDVERLLLRGKESIGFVCGVALRARSRDVIGIRVDTRHVEPQRREAVEKFTESATIVEHAQRPAACMLESAHQHHDALVLERLIMRRFFHVDLSQSSCLAAMHGTVSGSERPTSCHERTASRRIVRIAAISSSPFDIPMSRRVQAAHQLTAA
ncbi:hypothetical protein X946_4930 [Burkholderia sp. ABCPW 111]|nr:hypothetical protein X946_4930 [Burkholderia sp. ABCPW 111]